MKTYVWAQNTPLAGQVVIPQPLGDKRYSVDYQAFTLRAARAIRATLPHNAGNEYAHRAAKNVIDYRR